MVIKDHHNHKHQENTQYKHILSPHVSIIQLNLVSIQYNESSLKGSIELDVNPTQLKYEYDQKRNWA